MRAHVKNLLAISVSCFIIGSAYMSLQNLTSSLYASGGLGFASLATIYCFFALSCLIAPLIIGFLGTKWTFVSACACYCFYIAMNFYPRYYTLIPASMLLGLGAGPFWSAQGTHITTAAINLADITSEAPSAVISRFSGVFFFYFLASQVPGNLVSSLVLYGGTESVGINETDLSVCGANYCGALGSSNSTINNTPDKTTIYILFSTLLAWALLSIPTAGFFVDPLPSFCSTLPPKTHFKQQLKGTIHLATSPKVYLLIILIMYNGLELAFAYGDFTQAFVSCTQGVQTIGFVMTAFGIGGSISALGLGVINKYTGRIPIFTVGFLIQAMLMTLMIFWDPVQGEVWHLYLMAVTFSFGTSLRESQITAFLGTLFPKDQEAAFANFRFWQSISYSLAFVSSIPQFVCIWYKLVALLFILCLGMGLYYLLEWRIRNEVLDYEVSTATEIRYEKGEKEEFV